MKKHRLTLKGHTEEVTDAELAAIQKMTGDRFAEYTVEPIQPDKPADVQTPTTKTRAADKAE